MDTAHISIHQHRELPLHTLATPGCQSSLTSQSPHLNPSGLAVTGACRGSKTSPKVRVRQRRKLNHVAFSIREARQ